MYLGYNSNGFSHHAWEDAFLILAELGYKGVAITLDYSLLNPFAPILPEELLKVQSVVRKLGLRTVIETGARFLLDPRRKHQPTLLSRDPLLRGKRIDFLKRAIAIARDLGSDAVSFWSGAPDDAEPAETLFSRLVEGCQYLSDFAAAEGVRLAFEPEPGMLIDSMQGFHKLESQVNQANFGLTLDIGHLQCQGELPISDHIRACRQVLWNVHIEDMKKGTHDHLMFGQGEIDFPPIMRELKRINYQGGVYVELSRHAHDAVESARKSISFLKSFE